MFNTTATLHHTNTLFSIMGKISTTCWAQINQRVCVCVHVCGWVSKILSAGFCTQPNSTDAVMSITEGQTEKDEQSRLSADYLTVNVGELVFTFNPGGPGRPGLPCGPGGPYRK